eukprot:2626659-Ditylum_brightwellii.AAC.1
MGDDVKLDTEGRVGITASYDTQWQMRGSGWSYNSCSSAGYMIRVFPALFIGKKMYSKLCCLCWLGLAECEEI